MEQPEPEPAPMERAEPERPPSPIATRQQVWTHVATLTAAQAAVADLPERRVDKRMLQWLQTRAVDLGMKQQLAEIAADLSSDDSVSAQLVVDSLFASRLANGARVKQWERGGMGSADLSEGVPPTMVDAIEPRQRAHADSAPTSQPLSVLSSSVDVEEDPDDDTMAHREITRDHLVAMAEAVGLDDELLDSMVDALDGDLQGTAGMLQGQGAPDPWTALETKEAKATAAGVKANAKSAATEPVSQNIDAHRATTAGADPKDDDETLADRYLTPAHRLPEAAPPASSPAPPPATPRSLDDLMALKPSRLVKEAKAVGVDQVALETAQDGEQPREDIVALIMATQAYAGEGRDAAVSLSKSRKEQLREVLEPHGYGQFSEAVAAALRAAEVPSKHWLKELNDIEDEGQLQDFLVGVQKTYTPDGVLRSEREASVVAGVGAGGGHTQSASDTAHDANRSALFAGSKKAADSANSRRDMPASPMHSSVTMSHGDAAAPAGVLGPSTKVLEAQQRVRQNLEQLGDLSDRTKQMEENSQQFASMATQLRKKKQFGGLF